MSSLHLAFSFIRYLATAVTKQESQICKPPFVHMNVDNRRKPQTNPAPESRPQHEKRTINNSSLQLYVDLQTKFPPRRIHSDGKQPDPEP